MGGGCSSRPEILNEEKSEADLIRQKTVQKLQTQIKSKSSNSIYHNYSYKGFSALTGNLIMFTSIKNHGNEFTIMEAEKREFLCMNTYKVQGVAVGYHKGYKLDVHNQDKFFILMDGNVEVYCLIDGHGPYGEVIAQIVQDNLFKVS